MGDHYDVVMRADHVLDLLSFKVIHVLEVRVIEVFVHQVEVGLASPAVKVAVLVPKDVVRRAGKGCDGLEGCLVFDGHIGSGYLEATLRICVVSEGVNLALFIDNYRVAHAAAHGLDSSLFK